MGLFDRLKSIVASAASVDMRGPLKLSLGDGVAYYQEKYVLAGVRRLDAQGAITWHYCLRDAEGAQAVLVAEEGADLTLAMHQVVDSGIPWDKDVLEGVGAHPLQLAVRGQASVVATGDTGGATPRSVSFRQFRDADGGCVAALEDWGGRKEARIGEPVFEAELQFTRSESDAEAVAEAVWYSTRAESDAQPGSAGAAALLLEGTRENARDVADVVPADDRDPTAYSDDAWSDEPEPVVEQRPSAILTVFDSEEDEWRAAAAHLRQHGAPVEAS